MEEAVHLNAREINLCDCLDDESSLKALKLNACCEKLVHQGKRGRNNGHEGTPLLGGLEPARQKKKIME